MKATYHCECEECNHWWKAGTPPDCCTACLSRRVSYRKRSLVPITGKEYTDGHYDTEPDPKGAA